MHARVLSAHHPALLKGWQILFLLQYSNSLEQSQQMHAFTGTEPPKPPRPELSLCNTDLTFSSNQIKGRSLLSLMLWRHPDLPPAPSGTSWYWHPHSLPVSACGPCRPRCHLWRYLKGLLHLNQLWAHRLALVLILEKKKKQRIVMCGRCQWLTKASPSRIQPP